MALWRKVLSSAGRSAARTTGRALSRHVLPDNLIPSWKTQKALSSGVSAIYRGSSKLVRKVTAKPKPTPAAKYPKPGKPRPAGPAPYLRPAHLMERAEFERSAYNMSGPGAAPAWEMQAMRSRAKLVALDQRRAEAERNRLYKSPALARVFRPGVAVRSGAPVRAAAPYVRPQVPNEPKFNKNAWNQGRAMNSWVDWSSSGEMLGPFPPRRVAVASKPNRLQRSQKTLLASHRQLDRTSSRKSRQVSSFVVSALKPGYSHSSTREHRSANPY